MTQYYQVFQLDDDKEEHPIYLRRDEVKSFQSFLEKSQEDGSFRPVFRDEESQRLSSRSWSVLATLVKRDLFPGLYNEPGSISGWLTAAYALISGQRKFHLVELDQEPRPLYVAEWAPPESRSIRTIELP